MNNLTARIQRDEVSKGIGSRSEVRKKAVDRVGKAGSLEPQIDCSFIAMPREAAKAALRATAARICRLRVRQRSGGGLTPESTQVVDITSCNRS